MHRFYLPPDQCQASTLLLEERAAHHGLHVLRLRPGERVVVLDGAGQELSCEVGDSDRHTLRLAVRHKNFTPPLPYEMTLIQAVPKGKIFENIIQKATELGVSRIVPLLSERVATHLDEETSTAKAEKWRATASPPVRGSI